jgi:hypothetical protein
VYAALMQSVATVQVVPQAAPLQPYGLQELDITAGQEPAVIPSQ